MPRANLSAQDDVPSPEANRPRRHTVANPLLTDSELFAPSSSQESMEAGTMRLRRWTEQRLESNRALPDIGEPLDGGMEDVALEEEEEEDDDDWDMVPASQPREGVMASCPMSTAMTRIRNLVWPRDQSRHRDEDRHHHHHHHHQDSFVFDDEDMISLDGEAEEEEGEGHPERRDPSWDFNIPFGPRVQTDYTFEQLYPRTAVVLDFAETLPGMQRLNMARDVVSDWVPAIQNNVVRAYNDAAPRAIYTAQRAQEAIVVSGQVGSYLAGEAWTAGQNAAHWMRESWQAVQPAVEMMRQGGAMRVLMEGEVVRMVLQDAAMAGLASIPPYDLILRSSGGRRRF
ncbi:hypothetical protein ACHAPT_004197 [Fusarium lateritium]